MKRKYFAAAALILFSILSVGIWTVLHQEETDTISISIQEKSMDENGVSLLWVVENKSDHPVEFAPDAIMQVTVDHRSMNTPTEAITLQPGERFERDFSTSVIDSVSGGTVTMTATTADGTEGTFCKTFTPQRISSQ